MQIEPPKAEPPKRKRRWFQFSLRTLMIFTLICAVACDWFGWQAKIVRDKDGRTQSRRQHAFDWN
jgi:hypothetical protein